MENRYNSLQKTLIRRTKTYILKGIPLIWKNNLSKNLKTIDYINRNIHNIVMTIKFKLIWRCTHENNIY